MKKLFITSVALVALGVFAPSLAQAEGEASWTAMPLTAGAIENEFENAEATLLDWTITSRVP